jgi:hypothetical protein
MNKNEMNDFLLLEIKYFVAILLLFGATPVFISTSIFEIGFFNHWFMHKKAMCQHFWPSSSCIQD